MNIHSILNWFKKIYDKIFGKKIEPIVDIRPIISSATHVVEAPTRTCAHNYVLEKQVWVRVAPKKYELQYEYSCDSCNHRKTEPII